MSQGASPGGQAGVPALPRKVKVIHPQDMGDRWEREIRVEDRLAAEKGRC
jgi:hypothetical protein